MILSPECCVWVDLPWQTLPLTPIDSALRMVPLPGLYCSWLAAILVEFCTLTQSIKIWFDRQIAKRPSHRYQRLPPPRETDSAFDLMESRPCQ